MTAKMLFHEMDFIVAELCLIGAGKHLKRMQIRKSESHSWASSSAI